MFQPPPVTSATRPRRRGSIVALTAAGLRRGPLLAPHLRAMTERRLHVGATHVGDGAVRADVAQLHVVELAAQLLVLRTGPDRAERLRLEGAERRELERAPAREPGDGRGHVELILT